MKDTLRQGQEGSYMIVMVLFVTDGVKTYRKTLKDSRNGRSDAVQHRVRIRSRQQRVSIGLMAVESVQ